MIKDKLKYSLRHNFFLEKEIKKIDAYFKLNTLKETQNQAFLKLIKAAQKTTFYPKFYKENGIDIYKISSLDDLPKLPVLTKAMVKTNPKAFLSKKMPIGIIKGFTSGSTGSPLMVYRDLKAILKENAYVWWYRNNCGLTSKDRKISFRSDLNRTSLFKFNKAENTLYISPNHLNKENAKQIIDKVKDFAPKALISYPSTAYNFALLLAKENTKLKIPLTFTSSENILGFQREKIEQLLTTTIFDWYGNAERTIALYSENDAYYEPPLYAITEYKQTEVITTGLINTTFPLIRYQVNDLIETTSTYSATKKSVEIKSIVGRLEDAIVLKNGTRINRLNRDFTGIEGLQKAQVIQVSLDKLCINLVKEEEAKTIATNILEAKLRKRLGDEVEIEFQVILEKDLITSASGKYKFVISKI